MRRRYVAGSCSGRAFWGLPGCYHTYGANGIWQVNTRERSLTASRFSRAFLGRAGCVEHVAAQLPGSSQLSESASRCWLDIHGGNSSLSRIWWIRAGIARITGNRRPRVFREKP